MVIEFDNILEHYFKDVNCEFDEFRVDTRVCRLRCRYLYYTEFDHICAGWRTLTPHKGNDRIT